jgi:hypothetical protein
MGKESRRSKRIPDRAAVRPPLPQRSRLPLFAILPWHLGGLWLAASGIRTELLIQPWQGVATVCGLVGPLTVLASLRARPGYEVWEDARALFMMAGGLASLVLAHRVLGWPFLPIFSIVGLLIAVVIHGMAFADRLLWWPVRVLLSMGALATVLVGTEYRTVTTVAWLLSTVAAMIAGPLVLGRYWLRKQVAPDAVEG